MIKRHTRMDQRGQYSRWITGHTGNRCCYFLVGSGWLLCILARGILKIEGNI